MRMHNNATLVLCHHCGDFNELWHTIVVAVVAHKLRHAAPAAAAEVGGNTRRERRLGEHEATPEQHALARTHDDGHGAAHLALEADDVRLARGRQRKDACTAKAAQPVHIA